MIRTADLALLGLGGGPDPELLEIRQMMRSAIGYSRWPAPQWDDASPRAHSDGMGAFDVGSILRGAVTRARFRSNVTPSVEWDPSAPSSPSSGSGVDIGSVGRTIQPTLDLTLSNGQTVTIAPAGEATGDYRLIVGGVVVGGLTLFGLTLAVGYALGKRSARRRR